MQPLHARLKISQEDLLKQIHDLYWNQKLSQNAIAQYFQCHITTIENIFRKGLVVSRTNQEACRNTKENHCKINQKQKDILNGLLLSDFHIEKGTFQARLSFGFKHKEFAELCMRELNCFQWYKLSQAKTTGCWHSKTAFYKELFDLRNVWYPEGVKIVPDIKLSKESIMYWFLGDGMKDKRGHGAIFCCESFNIKDNLKLSNMLNKINIKNHLTPSNRIRISGQKGFKSLIEFIGDSPIECYKYKFKL